MEQKEKRRQYLATLLCEEFSDGICATGDVMNYIDSVFSNPSFEEISGILLGEDDSERASLMELILFPDESLQMRLEDILTETKFQKEDPEKVAGLMAASLGSVTLHLPRGAGSITIPFTIDDALSFIARLKITKNLGPDLCEELKRSSPGEKGRRLRVMFRNSSFAPSKEANSFLIKFFHKMGGKENIDFYLEIVLKILEDTRGDIFQSLSARRSFHLKNLQLAGKKEDLHTKHNIETLILQGVRSPHIDVAREIRMVAAIEDISFAVFGRV